MSRRGALLFAAMSVIWGVPYLLIKVAVVDLGPVVLVAGRLVLAVAVLLPFALRRGALRAAWRHRGTVAAYAAVEMAAPWWLLSHAELRVSSSFAGLVIATVPLVGAGIAWALHRERLDGGRAVGLLVGLVGVVLLLGVDLAGGADALAVVELLVVAVCYAVGPIIVARRLGEVPALGVNTLALALAALVYVPWALTDLPATPPGPAVLGAVVVLGLVCTALAFLLFFALIAEVGAARATVITYVNPAVALVLGVALLGERVTLGMLVGFPLVLVGSVLATRRSRPPVPEPVALPDAAGDEPPTAPDSRDTAGQPARRAAKVASRRPW
ncbi:DMT family transporter [Aquipuribacter nitratireducens]|uniref:DMT family transporter n=1 Tax=Aquipuribacter nitratireducens TaxID=650104 RepID=A0ABW0GP70_9MICO